MTRELPTRGVKIRISKIEVREYPNEWFCMKCGTWNPNNKKTCKNCHQSK